MDNTKTDLLQTIKDQTVKENFDSWELFMRYASDSAVEEMWIEVCKRYAFEVAKASLKEASEKALRDFIAYIPGHFPTEFKASITDESNIKL